MEKIRIAQAVLGGKVISDPHPFLKKDTSLWISLLTESTKKSISLYATLVKLRAIGASLEKHPVSGYRIEPILRSEENRWGFPSIEVWNKEKAALMPHLDVLKLLLRDLKE